jgi:hypothetical protein
MHIVLGAWRQLRLEVFATDRHGRIQIKHSSKACNTFTSVQGSAQRFAAYLTKYRNTICGRHPIGVLLNVSGFVPGRDSYENKSSNKEMCVLTSRLFASRVS